MTHPSEQAEPVDTEVCDHFLKAKRGTTRLWAHRYPHLLPIAGRDRKGRALYFVADVQACRMAVAKRQASDQRERISA